MKRFLLFFLGLSIFCSPLLAVPDFFQNVKQPITGAYIPNGFDNNDSVQIVLSGTFPNKCFQVGIIDKEVNEETRTVTVEMHAYEYTGECDSYPVPFHQVLRVGVIRTFGPYAVYDKTTGALLGKLQIDEDKTSQGGTDQKTYAPLLDAYFHQIDGKTNLHLSGVYASDCLELKDVTVLPKGNVVVVLPLMDKKEGVTTCTLSEHAFEKDIPVKETLPTKKYLLHVRALGGESINKVIVP